MASIKNSGEGHGSQGDDQLTIFEDEYPDKVLDNEEQFQNPPLYIPSPKHEPGSGWGSRNPIETQEEGQHLLDTGYQDGKQVYNITERGELVKFQPDNSPQNGFHSYEVKSPPDIPPSVLKGMMQEGRISKSEYKRILKGKKQ